MENENIDYSKEIMWAFIITGIICLFIVFSTFIVVVYLNDDIDKKYEIDQKFKKEIIKKL